MNAPRGEKGRGGTRVTGKKRIRIELQPLGKVLRVAGGTPLRDVLFTHGVEFPCGGRGRCQGCRVRVLDGTMPATVEDRAAFSPEEIAQGWRLSCRGKVEAPVKLELAQWEAAILSDHSSFAFQPMEGLGIAIDLGTTTVCAQLLDLMTGNVLSVRTGLNSQARFGADLMSRIEYAVTKEGQDQLQRRVRRQLGVMVRELLREAKIGGREVRKIVAAGNTAMHHLFCGIDVSPLSRYPFETGNDGVVELRADEVGWKIPGNPRLTFLPCLGGFVGSDLLAGILAVGLHESVEPVGLVDLGTNGEIVIGNRDKIVCASTAAGPAFEGAKISMGMRAATGAISEASFTDGAIRFGVIGGGDARGICGSGLVDVVAAGLEGALIQPGGRLSDRSGEMALTGGVRLSQTDIRELQLAKGAIAAGIEILAREWGVSPARLSRIHLAGAFGNYINRRSARRIGLLRFLPERIAPAGNTALLGAKIALFRSDPWWEEIRARTRHISLSANPAFQEIFVDEMSFPGMNEGSLNQRSEVTTK